MKVQRSRRRHDRTSALCACALLLAACSLLPAGVAAHEEGDGVDAGYGHVFATIGANNVAEVQLHISETDDCAKFRATQLTAVRDTASVNGDIQQLNPCQFGGSVTLPERGRWTVSVWLTYDGHPANIEIPVGASGDPGAFERADWLHIEASIASSSGDRAWYVPSGTLTYAVIGLLIGTALELARRRLMPGPAE
ncbi:MAG TPA: hypothetical protein VMM78_15810 [Thermomicrobiales bacterium]|nr:hypothetical protein [Thermomicrobiales bacterium]